MPAGRTIVGGLVLNHKKCEGECASVQFVALLQRERALKSEMEQALPYNLSVASNDAPTQFDHWPSGARPPIVLAVRMATWRSVAMDWLWLTLADPEPATNGQLIYSKGLIESASQAGASLLVVGLSRPESPRRGNDWHLVSGRPRPKWKWLLAPTPVVASRGRTREMEREIAACLASRTWEAVVFDSISVGWALDMVLRHRARSLRPPTIVYLAHNHEVTVAQRIAAAARGLKRVLKEFDALKTTRLERRLVSAADLVTSNTPEDCRKFAAGAGGAPVAFLPPGYGGPRVTSRMIDIGVPRRAIVVGSFDWPPKRISLAAFLAVAAPALARAGIELQIVGTVEMDYLAELRRRFPTVTFVGAVADVRPYMAEARIALVPDLLGGFKLKGLDYVFNRVPILALSVALPGMPLQHGRSIELFDTHQALAEGVVALIDDFPALNSRQEQAFAACADRFDWARIGRHLVARIRHADGRRGAVAASSIARPLVQAD